MNKIFIVTEGEYSDYRIVKAFSTEEKAKEYTNVCGGEVEEYEIDPEGWENEIENFIPGYWPFHIVYTHTTGNFEVRKMVWEKRDNRKNYCMPYGDNINIKWSIQCIAQDEQHALKIASERISQIKALNLIGCTFKDYWNVKFGERNPYQDI